jgi:hypothetical protein
MNKYYTWPNSVIVFNVIIPNKPNSYFWDSDNVARVWEEGYMTAHIAYMHSEGYCSLVPDTLTRLLGVPLWVELAR